MSRIESEIQRQLHNYKRDLLRSRLENNRDREIMASATIDGFKAGLRLCLNEGMVDNLFANVLDGRR